MFFYNHLCEAKSRMKYKIFVCMGP